MLTFHLTDAFLAKYQNKKPNWDALGEFVYYRTYSRYIEKENRNEQWWETIKRVVEGVYNTQKDHCEKLRLPWKPWKAQKSAQIMYDKIFNFKFSPAGRGLWMMGTEFIKEKSAAALMNCAFVSSEDIDVRGTFMFTWAMDLLMLGVGVGFDTKGANKIIIKSPKQNGGLTYQIPDTREGWVESVGMILDAFFNNTEIPKFDFSLIRPAGSFIHGFGGIASGPEPLIELHNNIKKLLFKKIGESLDSIGIVDIMNFIGVCVVSGNIRRSAQIALGDYTDTEYLNMKDFKKYKKELKDRRWASNNSIFVKIGETNYYFITKKTQENGEPGFVWLENIRKYSRMIDPPDYKDKNATGVNPCFGGKEKLLILEDGKAIYKSFKQLENKNVRIITPVNKIINGKVKCSGNKQTIKLIFGNWNELIVTPDHIFQTSKGKNILAKDTLNKRLNICTIPNENFDSLWMKLGFIQKEDVLPGKLPKDKELSFLRGLFSVKGSVIKKHRIALKLTCRKLAVQIKNLLNQHQINSYITIDKTKKIKSKNDRIYLDIEDVFSIINFYKLIGFVQKYKMNSLKKLIEKKSPKVIGIKQNGIQKVYDFIMPEIHWGFVNGFVVHNCAEQCLESYEVCNLVETYPSHHDTLEEYLETLKYAYLYAKSVTLIPTHWEETNQVIMKNRRIGTSQSGIIDAFVKHGRREMLRWCDEGYKVLKKYDQIYSDWLCVPKSIKITSVKPSGCGVLGTKIKTNKGIMTYEEIFEYFGYNVFDYIDENRLWLPIEEKSELLSVYDKNNQERKITNLFLNGIEDVYEFKTEDGNIHRFTQNHKFYVKEKGWVRVLDLEEDDDILSY